jgi:erythromycin esterase-like protein
VIYRPETELMSHYAEALLSRQFDAYLWFDETNAVTALSAANIKRGAPDTYPFGL